MKNSTGIPALDRLIRSLLQFIVSAGFTGLVSALNEGLTPMQSVVVLAVAQVIVTFAQNMLEDWGVVPTILKGGTEAEYAQQAGLKKDDFK